MTSPISVDAMKAHLGGIYWTPGKSPLAIPYFGNAFKSAMVFKKNLAEITWNCMRTLENNPTSLPQTRTILAGQSVGGISVFDLLQVKNYGDASKLLTEKVRSSTFALDKATACAIHNLSAREDTLVWGLFRTGNISIEGVKYKPPEASALGTLAQDGLGWLNTAVANPKERAIATFLFMSRSQFFYDANKRTASLMMNGVLMSNGYLPIVVLNKQSKRFHTELKAFYETGNADGMFAFFATHVTGLYSDLPKDELKPNPFAP